MKRLATIATTILATVTIAASASAAPLVFHEGRTVAYGVTLKPHTSTLVACQAGEEPQGMDAAAMHPYALTERTWIDGGEIAAFRTHGQLVATATPSQGPRGLGELRFTSYARTAAVEIICERA